MVPLKYWAAMAGVISAAESWFTSSPDCCVNSMRIRTSMKRKYELNLYAPFQYEDIQVHLEEMAERGLPVHPNTVKARDWLKTHRKGTVD